MKKLRMDRTKSLTLEEGCELYLNDCRLRNLREATINHYRQSYLQLFRAIDPRMPLNEVTRDVYIIDLVQYSKKCKFEQDVELMQKVLADSAERQNYVDMHHSKRRTYINIK